MKGTEPSIRKVVLLHGIWMPGLSMAGLAARLKRAGFEPRLRGYPGALGGPRVSTAQLAKRIADADAVVAHSLGGLMTLMTLRQYPELPIQRVVCLGSPLGGSAIARFLGHRHWSAWALGRSRDLLRQGVPPWTGRAEVGSIAGRRSRGVAKMVARFDDPSDGTVRVEETRLPGLADHCVVDASHSGLLLSKAAVEQVMHFLKTGRFRKNAWLAGGRETPDL